jgi:hypothetical protein
VAGVERSLGRWSAAADAGLRDALAVSVGEPGRPPAEIEAELAAAAKEWDAKCGEAVAAVRALPPDDGLSRLAEAESRNARSSLLGRVRPATLAAAGGGLLAVLGLVVAVAIAAGRRSRRASGPSRAASSPGRRAEVPATPPRAGPRPAGATGEIHSLDREVLSGGAAPENDVVATMRGVSRRHARIVRDAEGAFWLEDVGSRYGSKVNGRTVKVARLSDGDEIALGSWRATVRLDGAGNRLQEA